MTNNKIIVAVVVALALGVAGGYALNQWLSSDPQPASASVGRKVLYWHDPMVPGQRFDKPGKSPFMDMELVPVYSDEAPEGAAVTVSPQVSQNLGIRLGKVERAEFEVGLTAVGNINFNENLTRVVQARVDGFVQTLHVRAPLERVRRGQPLAEVVSPEWRAALEEYAALQGASSERAKEIRSATRERLVVLGVPGSAIASVEAGRMPSATTTIYSPINGVVSELGVREGSAFTTGSTLFRINGLSSVWATAQVPEAQASSVPVRGEVTARATAWPGEEFNGRVVALLPNVDAQTRTIPVRIEVDNRDGKLAPGMYVSLTLAPSRAQSQLVVPSEAVIMTGIRTAVIVVRDSGGFDVANVEIGSDSGGKTVVLAGLTEGQSVVLSGQFLIDSEASLTSTVSRLSGTQAPVSGMPSRGVTPSAPAVHTALGEIVAISADAVTLSHGAVPSLEWPPMTMPFKLPAEGMPPTFKVGDHVEFTFTPGDGGYQITSIKPSHAGHAP
jgi:Cu(I)/Ag(I) efflux system membrane fusion protein